MHKLANSLALFFIFILGHTLVMAQYDNQRALASERLFDFSHEPPLSSDTVDFLKPAPARTNLTYRYSSVCDPKGNLQFYTNHALVWNKYHQILNQADTNFREEVIPILVPTHHHHRYLLIQIINTFTSGKLIDSGLYISLLDRTLNQGEGDFVPGFKRRKLQSEHFIGLAALEKEPGVFHLIIRNRTGFYTYQIIDTLFSTAQYSPSNMPIPFNPLQNNLLGIHYKLTPGHSNQYLIEQFYYDSFNLQQIRFSSSRINFYQYNPNSKHIFGYQEVYRDLFERQIHPIIIEKGETYRINTSFFSPRDKILYVMPWVGGAEAFYDKDSFEIWQYSVDELKVGLPNRTRLKHPKTSWRDVPRYGFSGNNHKVYICNADNIYQIRYPDLLGKDGQIQLLTKDSLIIFNQFGHSFGLTILISQPNVRFELAFDCQSQYKLLNLSDTTVNKKFDWYVYNQTGQLLDSSNNLDLPFNYSPGLYYVKLRGWDSLGYGRWYSDTIDIPIQNRNLARFSLKENTLCLNTLAQINDSSFSDLVAANTPRQWHYFFGDGTDTLFTKPPGSFSHLYKDTGTFYPWLVYSNSNCFDTFYWHQGISIKAAPAAGLQVQPKTGCQPLAFHAQRAIKDQLADTIKYQINGQKFSLIGDAPDFHYTLHQPGSYLLQQQIIGASGCIVIDTTTILVLKGFDSSQIPQWKTISVVQDQHLELEWLNQDAAIKYTLFKNNAPTPIKVYEGASTRFIDSIVEVNQYSYSYYFVASDTCQATIQSKEGKSILLEGENINNDYSQLQWTLFNAWRPLPTEYQIAQVEGGMSKIFSNTLNNQYADQDFLQQNQLEKCYRVYAIQTDSNYLALSNVLCIPYELKFWMPNAFTPNHNNLNETFAPVGVGILPENYQLSIYNRWGQEIFTSLNPAIGWDGTFKGNPAPEGVYLYKIKVTGYKGNFTRSEYNSGSFTLIR